MLRLFPRARYLLSTQPVVNMSSGDFVNVYDFPSDSVEHRTAMNKRAADLEVYLTAHQTEDCSAAHHPVGRRSRLLQTAALIPRRKLEGRLQSRPSFFVARFSVGSGDQQHREPRLIQ